MERKLATIRKITSISPIEGADSIELAKIDGWQVVVKKGEFKENDPCVYVEIDSILDPENPEFLFMQNRRFRVRTIKLRGQLSQGIAFSVCILPFNYIHDDSEFTKGEPYRYYVEGEDVTDILKITKYEPNIPANLSGKIKGYFPTFLRKTDEERIQNLSQAYENYRKSTYYVTEKLDGSSATFYLNNGSFGCCSRNIDLLEDDTNLFWKVARAMEIEKRMRELAEESKGAHVNFAIQGELIGNGVQGNKYGLEANTVRFYNWFDIDMQQYAPMSIFSSYIKRLGFQTVPILDDFFPLPPSIDELLKYAEGKSTLNNNTEREGLVLRNESRTISFKVISNKFLLKNEE